VTERTGVHPGLDELDAAPAGDDELLYVLFLQHYSRLVRFAVAVSGSAQYGEDAVQEAFARLFARPRRLRDRDAAEAYLRSAVFNAARTGKRRRAHETPNRPELPGPLTADPAPSVVDRHDVVAALRELPRREREAIALRYLLDLSERDTARELRVSVGAVKGYTSRGLDRLATLLGSHRD